MGRSSTSIDPLHPSNFQLPHNFTDLFEKAIRKEKKGKAVAKDRINVEMLQCAPAECVRLLANIWKTCGRLAIYPDLWKQGILIPMHKKGPQHLPENNRPICLLSHARKMIEHAISSIVTSEFTPHHNQFGFRTHQSIDSAILLAAHNTSTDPHHIDILDLSKAYDSVDRHLLIRECKNRLNANTVAMIQSSLLPTNLTTAGDVTNSSTTCCVGVPQGSILSPPLFNIFIDPLAQKLHRTTNPSTIPKNALLADDVIIYAKHTHDLQDQFNICTEWASQNGINWNPQKCFVILQPHPNTSPQHLTISNHPISTTESQEHLGITLSASGIRSARNVERALAASSLLQLLLRNPHFKNSTSMRSYHNIFTTLVKSKYIYALHHIPLSQSLLEKDTMIQRKLFKGILNMTSLPSPNQIDILQGILRITSLQMTRNTFIHNFASKIHQRLNATNTTTKGLAERDRQIIQLRSPFDHLRRAMANTQSTDQLLHARFCGWNSMRKGTRKPAPFQNKHWPPALSLPTTNKVFQVMAVKWHIGRFPIPTDLLRAEPQYRGKLEKLKHLQKSKLSTPQKEELISAIRWSLEKQTHTHRTESQIPQVLLSSQDP